MMGQGYGPRVTFAVVRPGRLSGEVLRPTIRQFPDRPQHCAFDDLARDHQDELARADTGPNLLTLAPPPRQLRRRAHPSPRFLSRALHCHGSRNEPRPTFARCCAHGYFDKRTTKRNRRKNASSSPRRFFVERIARPPKLSILSSR